MTNKGLYPKYKIEKTNGEPVSRDAEYFVLRLDFHEGCSRHVKACHLAALRYAEDINDFLPHLANDLRRLVAKQRAELVIRETIASEFNSADKKLEKKQLLIEQLNTEINRLKKERDSI